MLSTAFLLLGFLKFISGTSVQNPTDFVKNVSPSRLTGSLEDELKQISADESGEVWNVDEPQDSTESSVAIGKFAVTVSPFGSDAPISFDSTEPSRPTVTDYASANTEAPVDTDYDIALAMARVAGSVDDDHEYWEDMTMTVSPVQKEIVDGEHSSVAEPSMTGDSFTETPVPSAKALDAYVETDVGDDRLQSKEIDLNSPMTKKSSSIPNGGRSRWTKYDEQLRKPSSSYEDVMEVIIKAAEHPKDWEEIEQILEKIEYEDATLKKAKSRLKALALKKQFLRKGVESEGKKKLKIKVAKMENEVLGKVPTSRDRHAKTAAKSRHRSHFETELPKFRSVPHRVHITTLAAKQDDYAVEQPVTVIGERSRVDPVEKELLEESTSQRLREIQREKARLIGADKSDDDDDDDDGVEDQLKALSKMERRLKDHWRQKQELMQRIKQKNQWKADRIDDDNSKW